MPQVVNCTPADLTIPADAGMLGWNGFERRFLAEGDSWFTLAAMPGGNLLQELNLDYSALIANTAYPGDTLSHIIDWRQNREFVNLLAVPKFAFKWDAILLSAGGNDLITAASIPDGILQEATADTATLESWINLDNQRKFECYVRANIESIVELRDSADSPNKGIPIVLHTYDYPTARPAPARLLDTVGISGPWLHKAYVKIGLPDQLWVPMTETLIDSLAQTLLDLRLENVHVVDTRGILKRAAAGDTGNSGDWLNEIHANRNGRKKLARRWAERLNRF